jgi:cell cycle sensor histidine kinase DivJ
LSLFAPPLASESFAHAGSSSGEAAEHGYRLLAGNMSDVIARHDANGAVLFVSPAAESLLGVAPAELLGQALFERVHVADRPAYLTALGQAARLDQSRTAEFRVRKGDANAGGSPAAFVWIEMRCNRIAATEGAAAGDNSSREVVSVLRDITARKQQEQALKSARAEAERANAAKSHFLATMSHELRTPLNAIIGFSEMLTEEKSLMIDAKRRHDYAQLIKESGHHLLAVVNGILDMSKIENGSFEIVPEPFAPRRVIEDCCNLLALNARERGLNLILDLEDQLPDIVADKRALNQIMLNLMANAIKFTNCGGGVTVRAKRDNDFIAISVTDTGIGIEPEDLPRIGDPFFQARSSYDRRHDGTGLGLSIVKGLLALHGGEIEIASRLGEGTCVTVRLPLDCDVALRPAAEPADDRIDTSDSRVGEPGSAVRMKIRA